MFEFQRVLNKTKRRASRQNVIRGNKNAPVRVGRPVGMFFSE